MNVHWVTSTSSITIYITYIKSHFECVGLVVHVSLHCLCLLLNIQTPKTKTEPTASDCKITSKGLASQVGFKQTTSIYISLVMHMYMYRHVYMYIHVYTHIPCSVLTSLYNHILLTYWKKCFPYFLIKYSLACVFWSHLKDVFVSQMATKSLLIWYLWLNWPFAYKVFMAFLHQHVQTFIMSLKRPWIILQTSHFWGPTCF